MMNLEKAEAVEGDKVLLTDADKWILSKCNTLVKEVTDNMESFELGIAVQKIYDFIWEEFCDWYIEMVKPRLYNDADETKAGVIWTLKQVLITSLKLLHPYMPFITEEIYCTLLEAEGKDGEAESIMVSDWPVFDEKFNYSKEEEAVELMKEAVKGIRAVRAGMNVPPSKKASVIIVTENSRITEIFENSRAFFATLSYASEVTIQKNTDGIPTDAVTALIPEAVIYMPFAELVDIEKEIERLNQEKARLAGELNRVNGMLANERFVSKAPEAKIQEEKEKLAKYTQLMEQVEERLKTLTK
jgi:valyl-tRNA synthetase